jgi:hypothetical protein
MEVKLWVMIKIQMATKARRSVQWPSIFIAEFGFTTCASPTGEAKMNRV